MKRRQAQCLNNPRDSVCRCISGQYGDSWSHSRHGYPGSTAFNSRQWKGYRLKSEDVDRELEIYRAKALHFAGLLEMGLRFPELTGQVRHFMEDLICLAEEAPEERRSEIDYLIDRFGAIQKQMLN